MTTFTEEGVEHAAFDSVAALGWSVPHGTYIAPQGQLAERQYPDGRGR